MAQLIMETFKFNMAPYGFASDFESQSKFASIN